MTLDTDSETCGVWFAAYYKARDAPNLPMSQTSCTEMTVRTNNEAAMKKRRPRQTLKDLSFGTN